MPESKFKKILVFLVIGYCMSACNTNPASPETTIPAIYPIRNAKDIMDARKSLFVNYPTYREFSVCYGNTCRYIDTLELDGEEWSRIQSVFTVPAGTADLERQHISQAIAVFESMVGKKTGTSNDMGENFAGLGLDGQMDCVDEATNTSVYLAILQSEKLLKWHRVQSRVSRGIASLQAPHFTAVIMDIENSTEYAVDSWFLANGNPPFVVPLSLWRKGWKPGDPY